MLTHRLRIASLGALLAAALSGCSTQALPQGSVTFLIGQETDAWTSDPAPSTVRLELVQAGARSTLAELPAPATSFVLPRGGPENVQVSFEATASDAQGNPLLHGKSSPVTLQGYDDASLYVFVARSGFARPYGAMQYEHHHPLLTSWPNAFLLISGGDTAGSDATQLDVYDDSVASLVPNEPSLPQTAKSSATAGEAALLVGDTSTVWIDLVTGSSTAAVAPTGFAFSEVLGGKTWIAPDGTQYLVGATRVSGAATDKVLQIAADGTLTVLTLSAPRLNAAAGFVEGNLVVAGGSASAAGAEVLAAGATSFVPLSLPPDATQGAGLAELSETSAILAGGHDPTSNAASATRTLDLGCQSDCSATELSDIPLALSRVQAFSLAPNQALVIGEADDGETHAFLLDVSGATPVSTEQLFHDRRAGAAAALLGNGQVVVVGGDDPESGSAVATVEQFFP